jgi:hypothetical protein
VFDNSDADTPAPTRVLRNRAPSPSVVIERVHDPDFDDDDLDDDDLESTRLRSSAQRVAVAAAIDEPTTDPRQSIAQLPLPPPPASNERPSLVPLSGSRTSPLMKAQHTLAVESADVLHEANIAAPIAAAPSYPLAPRTRTSNWIIALLLVLTAAAAGAVVYFGLPYIQ